MSTLSGGQVDPLSGLLVLLTDPKEYKKKWDEIKAAQETADKTALSAQDRVKEAQAAENKANEQMKKVDEAQTALLLRMENFSAEMDKSRAEISFKKTELNDALSAAKKAEVDSNNAANLYGAETQKTLGLQETLNQQLATVDKQKALLELSIKKANEKEQEYTDKLAALKALV